MVVRWLRCIAGLCLLFRSTEAVEAACKTGECSEDHFSLLQQSSQPKLRTPKLHDPGLMAMIGAAIARKKAMEVQEALALAKSVTPAKLDVAIVKAEPHNQTVAIVSGKKAGSALEASNTTSEKTNVTTHSVGGKESHYEKVTELEALNKTKEKAHSTANAIVNATVHANVTVVVVDTSEKKDEGKEILNAHVHATDHAAESEKSEKKTGDTEIAASNKTKDTTHAKDNATIAENSKRIHEGNAEAGDTEVGALSKTKEQAHVAVDEASEEKALEDELDAELHVAEKAEHRTNTAVNATVNSTAAKSLQKVPTQLEGYTKTDETASVNGTAVDKSQKQEGDELDASNKTRETATINGTAAETTAEKHGDAELDAANKTNEKTKAAGNATLNSTVNTTLVQNYTRKADDAELAASNKTTAKSNATVKPTVSDESKENEAVTSSEAPITAAKKTATVKAAVDATATQMSEEKKGGSDLEASASTQAKIDTASKDKKAADETHTTANVSKSKNNQTGNRSNATALAGNGSKWNQKYLDKVLKEAEKQEEKDAQDEAPAPAAKKDMDETSKYFWVGKNGNQARAGYSPYAVTKDFTGGPTWNVVLKPGEVKSTPLIDELQNVYFTTIHGHVYKYDTEGKHLWNHSVGANIQATPMIAEGQLFLSTDMSEVVAISMITGNITWRKTMSSCSNTTAFSVTAGSGVVIVGARGGGDCGNRSYIQAVDAAKGDSLWTFLPSHAINDKGFLSAMFAIEGSAMVFTTVGGDAFKLDLHSGAQLWAHESTLDKNSSVLAAKASLEYKPVKPPRSSVAKAEDEDEVSKGSKVVDKNAGGDDKENEDKVSVQIVENEKVNAEKISEKMVEKKEEKVLEQINKLEEQEDKDDKGEAEEMTGEKLEEQSEEQPKEKDKDASKGKAKDVSKPKLNQTEADAQKMFAQAELEEANSVKAARVARSERAERLRQHLANQTKPSESAGASNSVQPQPEIQANPRVEAVTEKDTREIALDGTKVSGDIVLEPEEETEVEDGANLQEHTGVILESTTKVTYITSNPRNADGKRAGRLEALDFATGKVLWQVNLDTTISNGPVVGQLHPSGEGDLSVLVVVSNSGSASFAGRKYTAKLLAFAAKTGATRNWSYQQAAWTDNGKCPQEQMQAFSNPAIGGDGTVYVGSGNGLLYAIADRDGDGYVDATHGSSDVTAYNGHTAFIASPGIAPGMLVAAPCDGLVVFKLF